MTYNELSINSQLMRYLEDREVLTLVLYKFKRLMDELVLDIEETDLKNKKKINKKILDKLQ